MLLDLPDIRQETDFDCGGATLRVLCDYWSVPIPPSLKRLASPKDGLSPDVLEGVLRSLRFKVHSGNYTIPLLRATTREGLPVAVLIQYEQVGHWVTVRGVERGRVHYTCPLDGRKSLTETEWDRRWVDYHRLGFQFDGWAVVPFL